MPDEKTTAELEAEKKATDDAVNNVDGEGTDGGDGGDGADADVDKKDYSKMSDDEIVADLKEKNPEATADDLLLMIAKDKKIIGHKNRAIDSMKKTNKTDETKTEKKVEEKPKEEIDDLDKPLTKRDLVEQNNLNAIGALINTETTDPEKRKAILDSYENDIKKSGDIAKDFNKALAIASKDEFSEFRKNQIKSVDDENNMTNFSGAGNGGAGNNSGPSNDAVKRATAENLKKAGYSDEQIKETLDKK